MKIEEINKFEEWFNSAFKSEHVKDGDWQPYMLDKQEIWGSTTCPKDVEAHKELIEECCRIAYEAALGLE